MKQSRSALLQLIIWIGIWSIFAFSFGNSESTASFYLTLILRICVLAALFNVLAYGLLPMYFSGKKQRFYLLTALVIVGYLFLSVTLELTLFRPPKSRVEPYDPMVELAKNWKYFLIPNVFTIAAIFGSAAAIRALSAYESQKKAEEEANRRRLEAEIALLKSQINPHFLLNTINNLYALALTEPDKTPDALLKLAAMMKYILYECAQPQVPLSHDLAFIESYISLQQLRLPPNITLLTELPESVPEHASVEPMILITFIENAFKHGLTTRQPCTISISLVVKEDRLMLKVVNPIPPARSAPSLEPSGIGAVNTRQRLEHFYPGLHHLHILNDGQTYRVELELIFHT